MKKIKGWLVDAFFAFTLWACIVMLSESVGWYWFDDAMRASCWRQGIYSGPGPAPVWAIYFWAPIGIIWALAQSRRENRTEDSAPNGRTARKSDSK